MRNTVLAFIIVFAITCMIIANSANITRICRETGALIDSGNYREAAEKWERSRDYLSLFLRDAEIDAADLHARGLMAALDSGSANAEEHAVGFRDALEEIIACETVSFLGVFRVDNSTIKEYYINGAGTVEN